MNTPLGTLRTMRLLSGGLVLLMLFCALGAEPVPARSKPRTEREVKAAYLFNFLQFVEWPQEVMESTKGEYRIGILGDNPLSGILERIVEGETLNNRKISIIHLGDEEPRHYCHIFYVPATEAGRMAALQRWFTNNPALVVSDIPGFAERGGMVELVKKENKIQLRVNLAAIKQSEINVSSRLLRLAEVVGPKQTE